MLMRWRVICRCLEFHVAGRFQLRTFLTDVSRSSSTAVTLRVLLWLVNSFSALAHSEAPTRCQVGVVHSESADEQPFTGREFQNIFPG